MSGDAFPQRGIRHRPCSSLFRMSGFHLGVIPGRAAGANPESILRSRIEVLNRDDNARLPSHFDCGVWIPDRRCAALALGGLVAVGVMAGVRNDAHGLSGAGAPGSARGLRDPSGACEAPWWAGPLRSGRPRARYLERGLQDPPPGARAKIRKAGLRGLPPGRCASRRSTAERAFAHPAAGGHRRAAGPGRGSAARHDGAAEFASSTRTTA
jgi:hypothetical protein